MPAIVQSHSQSQAGLMFVTSLEMDNSDWWMHISHLSQIIGRAQRKKGWISTVFAFNRWNLALLPYKQWKHFLDLWPLQGIKRHPPFHWALNLCQHFFRATLTWIQEEKNSCSCKSATRLVRFAGTNVLKMCGRGFGCGNGRGLVGCDWISHHILIAFSFPEILHATRVSTTQCWSSP